MSTFLLRQYLTLKRGVTWFLIPVALVGLVISYLGIYLLVFSIAAGLVWWVEWALLLSGPLALATSVFAYLRPRQRVAVIIAFLLFTAWGVLIGFTFFAGFRRTT
jgi:hypothetical protein